MYARITWGRVKPGHWDAYERAYADAIVVEPEPAGLRGRMLLHDSTDPDSGGSLSLWEDHQAAVDYQASKLRSRMLATMENHFADDFISHICEVRFTLPTTDAATLGNYDQAKE